MGTFSGIQMITKQLLAFSDRTEYPLSHRLKGFEPYRLLAILQVLPASNQPNPGRPAPSARDQYTMYTVTLNRVSVAYLKIAYKIQSRQHRRALEYIWASFVYNKSIEQIPQCFRRISRNVLFCNGNEHTHALFCYNVMYVGYWTGALCDLCNRSFCCIKFCLIVMNLHYHPHDVIVGNGWSTFIMLWLKNIRTR